MPKITSTITIAEHEIELTPIRAQGAGGQNVNKVSSAIHLRFNIWASSLPLPLKQRLLALHDHRITKDGTIIIKAQQARSQEKNRQQALLRLENLIKRVAVAPKVRKATKPTKAATAKRQQDKVHRSKLKALRRGEI